MSNPELIGAIRALVQAIEYTPLGERAIKALEKVRPFIPDGQSSFMKTVLPRRLAMEYTDPTCLRTVYDISVDFSVNVMVVGDPENGAYEWLIKRDTHLVHSNSGYGCADIALRDGLMVYWSEPIDFERLKREAKTVTLRVGL